MPVKLESTGHDHQIEPAAPRGWSQSFPFWPALCGCLTRARLFLFGFLQEWVTFTMEDFIWSVASATAVPHSFLLPLHRGGEEEKPHLRTHTCRGKRCFRQEVKHAGGNVFHHISKVFMLPVKCFLCRVTVYSNSKNINMCFFKEKKQHIYFT